MSGDENIQQGTLLPLPTCSGTRVLLNFIKDIEARCPGQIKVVDIGGGLSTSYTERGEPEGFTYQKYRDLLDKEA